MVACLAAAGTLLAVVSTSRADVVVLKDGLKVEGRIVNQTDKFVEVKVTKFGVTVTRKLRRDRITSIRKDGEADVPEPERPLEQTNRAEQRERPARKDSRSTVTPARGDGEPKTKSARRKRLPLRLDLREPLAEPLIRQTFEDDGEPIEPTDGGQFVLVPFSYEAIGKRYRVSRYTIKFLTDKGKARFLGFVPLQGKPAGRKAPRVAKRAEGDEKRDNQTSEPAALRPVKGRPVYERMTVYEESGKLMVRFEDLSKSKREDKSASAGPAPDRSNSATDFIGLDAPSKPRASEREGAETDGRSRPTKLTPAPPSGPSQCERPSTDREPGSVCAVVFADPVSEMPSVPVVRPAVYRGGGHILLWAG